MYPLSRRRPRGRAVLLLGSLLGLLVLSGLLPGSNRAFAQVSGGAGLAFYSYPVQPPGELRNSFSASLDNEVYMQLSPGLLLGRHTASFTLIAPDQTIYQILHVSFTAGLHSGGAVWADAPIAGTGMNRLLGAWRVDARLDGNLTPLASASFRLTP